MQVTTNDLSDSDSDTRKKEEAECVKCVGSQRKSVTEGVIHLFSLPYRTSIIPIRVAVRAICGNIQLCVEKDYSFQKGVFKPLYVANTFHMQ